MLSKRDNILTIIDFICAQAHKDASVHHDDGTIRAAWKQKGDPPRGRPSTERSTQHKGSETSQRITDRRCMQPTLP